MCILPSMISNIDGLANDPAHAQLMKTEVPTFLKQAFFSMQFMPHIRHDAHTQLTKFFHGLLLFKADQDLYVFSVLRLLLG